MSFLDAIDEIKRKPFPPLMTRDLERLFWIKRHLIFARFSKEANALAAFEKKIMIKIPEAEINPLETRKFITDLQGKSYSTIIDILLISYLRKRLGDSKEYPKETELLNNYIRDKNIKYFTPKEEFLKINEEMVKGIRVGEDEKPQANRIENNPITEPSATSPDHIIIDTTPTVTPLHRNRGISPQVKHRLRSPQDTDTTSADDHYEDILGFREMSDMIDNNFWDEFTTSSTALDIVAVYLKGQKILYIEAKTHCEQHLNTLMMPAILLSAVATVLSLALKGYDAGTIIVSSITAANSFILSVISYLKLDAKAEAHKSSSYQFDKLQSQCEFHSGKVLFFKDPSAKVIVEEIEKKVAEIKDTNQFIIPEAVRFNFPKLYSTNVFTKVKEIENKENIIKNKINSLFNEMKKVGRDSPLWAPLEQRKAEFLEEYIVLRKEYLGIDKEFTQEINDNITKSRRTCNPCNWLKT